MNVVHLDQRKSRIDEIEDEVYLTVDRMCLRIGALLIEARSIEGDGFKAWVTKRMPFGWETARRLIAVSIAYSELPKEKIDQLPRPWQALYALAPFANGRLLQAIEAGEVGPDTTTSQARDAARAWRSTHTRGADRNPMALADRRASALMEFAADDLNDITFKALSRWVARRTS